MLAVLSVALSVVLSVELTVVWMADLLVATRLYSWLFRGLMMVVL
jgi:hypothetical protein